jgi:prepilin-type N-terminal cleavage/methylation domain-containing protein
MQLKKQTGFTLVEIAIVLVIVGLLIGGVLKGQEMITNAKLKRMESDNAGIAAAMFSYQDRYLQLPGDDSDVQARFSIYTDATYAPAAATAQSGTIDGTWNTTGGSSPYAETQLFWAHLRASGLVPGGGEDVTLATNAYGGQIGIQDGALNLSGHVTIFGQIEGPIAKIMEARLDDGKPDAGRIMSNIPSAAGASTSSMAPAGATPFALAAGYEDGKRYNMAFRL